MLQCYGLWSNFLSTIFSFNEWLILQKLTLEKQYVPQGKYHCFGEHNDKLNICITAVLQFHSYSSTGWLFVKL